MDTIIQVVLPVFGIVLAGYLSGRYKLLGEDSSRALNDFVYYFALPPLLFLSTARVEPAVIFNGPFLGSYMVGMLLTFVVALLFTYLAYGRHRLAERSVFGMTAIYGNTGYMGIPLVSIAFGPEGVLPAVIATVVNGAVVIGVIAALIETDLKVGGSWRGVVRDIVLALVRNPLFAAPLLGILVSFLGLSLPTPVERFCEILGAAAGPCALFAIGLFMVGKSVRRGASEVLGMTVLKLVIQPALTWGLALWLFPMDALWTAVAVVMAAMPAGAGVFVIAQRYGVYVERASAAILASTVLSVASLTLLLVMLR